MKKNIEDLDVMTEKSNWYQYCHKNIFLENLYNEAIPPLMDVDIVCFSIELSPDAVCATNAQLVVRLKKLPDNIPVKWQKINVNCIEMKLDIVEIGSICIKAGTSSGSDIVVYQDGKNVVVQLHGGLRGEIKCPMEHKKFVEDDVLISDNKCIIIAEIKGIHENR